jgi:hypothetical protein
MRILGVDPGIRGGLAVVAVEDGAAPRLETRKGPDQGPTPSTE